MASASWSGLVGWKPSTGRFPRIDGLPAILNDFETIGTLTRTLDDALLLDAAMAGPDARDRRSLYARDIEDFDVSFASFAQIQRSGAPIDTSSFPKVTVLLRTPPGVDSLTATGSQRTSSILNW